MAQMRLSDRAPLGGVRRTKDGFYVGRCRVAKGGNVQAYAGAELGKPDVPVIRVWRDPSVVFGRDAMRSFAHRTLVAGGHPPGNVVNADNWKAVSAGHLSGQVLREGDFVVVELALMDAAAIRAAERGEARELSAGYAAGIDFTPGTTPAGEPYDARLTSLACQQHVALVPSGRAGPECRVGDAARTPAAGATTVTTDTLNDQQAYLADAAQRLGAVVQGLPLADGAAVIADAIRFASIRADERRRKGPGTPYGEYLARMQTAHQQRG